MEQMNAKPLQGKRVAMLMTDGVEQVEYTSPRTFLEAHGATVVLLSPKAAGEDVQGFNQLEPADRFKVEMNVSDARSADFDGLVLPGGVANPDQLRMSKEAIAFIRTFDVEDKMVAAICADRCRHRHRQTSDQLAQPQARSDECRCGMDRRSRGHRRPSRDKPQPWRFAGL
jgi:hypothetical protein